MKNKAKQKNGSMSAEKQDSLFLNDSFLSSTGKVVANSILGLCMLGGASAVHAEAVNEDNSDINLIDQIDFSNIDDISDIELTCGIFSCTGNVNV